MIRLTMAIAVMLEKEILSAFFSPFLPFRNVELNKSRTIREQGSVKVDYGKFNKRNTREEGEIK